MSLPPLPATAFRPDIEGLRGIAVALVVLFHADVVGITGGFVGVDVFFVISGFLITGLLLREREATGGITLVGFYARRVRRLAPAAIVLLAVSLPVAYHALDPLTRTEVAADGAAAALSVANLRFALVAGDYFAPTVAPSPYLHFWSLAVEEQFYLVWPAVILVATRFRRPRLGAGLVIAAILLASLAACLVATEVAPGWAYYSLPTRAWQLAAGGLLAVGWAGLARLPAGPAAIIGWSGAVLLLASTRIDPTAAYPGAAAVVPTLAAVCLIAGGDRRFGPGLVLGLRPARFLGRISYSLYLWHWPILVLPVAASGGDPLPAGERLVLLALSVAVATASCLLVEEPVRRGLRLPARRTLSAGMAGVAAVAVLGTSLSVVSAREIEALAGPPAAPSVAAPVDLATAERSPAPTPTPTPTGTPAARPTLTSEPKAPLRWTTATPAPTPAPTPLPVRTASGPALPRDLRPALGDVRSDEERLRRDRCLAFEGATAPPDCVYGNPTAPFTVALVGDSHGSHLFPALDYVAGVRDWRIVPMLKVSCPFADLPVRSLQLKRAYTECARFRESTIDRLERLRPDLTVVAMSHWIFPLDPADDTVAREGAAVARALARVPGRTVLVADTPHAAEDSASCLAANVADIRACSTPKARALSGHGVIEQVAAEAAGVPLIDLADQICVASPCPAVVDGIVVYRDDHHLTATYARSLGPALDRALDPIVP